MWHHPEHMAPPGSVAGRVGVLILIAEAMMLAVCRNPHDRGAFASQCSAQGEQTSQWSVGFKAGVRQKSVKSQANPQTSRHPAEEHGQQQPVPSEVERSGEGSQVQKCDPDDRWPFQAQLPATLGWIVCRLTANTT